MIKIKPKRIKNHTADYLTPDELNKLLKYLAQNEKWLYYLIVKFGVSTALRFSDLSSLTWSDIYSNDQIDIKEKKTGKIRSIPISNELSTVIASVYEKLGNPEISRNIIGMTNNGINKQLKIYSAKAGIRNKNISTHTFRKSMARAVWERNNCSDAVLTKLSVLLKHSSTKITRIYLGITREEVNDLYSLDDMFVY